MKGERATHCFSEDLETVRTAVLNMGGLVEEQFERATRALSDADSELGLQVAHDDSKVNKMEVSIDGECSRLLATPGATASDLRLILAIIKTITDLERIGDEAKKMGLLAAGLAAVERPSANYRDLRNLARHVKEMIHGALDAFARLDDKEALEVVKSDDIVDEEYETIYRQAITFMMEDPRTIKRAMDITWIARSLERIGDHAKNICEYVIFMVYGEDIRHTGLENIEAAIAQANYKQETSFD
ncbi:MAG: phosphate signaling complex protein PhoU [Pseudomonadota bacterium]|nr:phosphate signaling complex protein PhoU [Pseudomonadota bacterium]